VLTVGTACAYLTTTRPVWLALLIIGLSALLVRGVDPGDRADAGGAALVSDQNPLAAMPSLHLALTLVIALTIWRVDRRLGIAATIYTVAMGVSLVYLGEHWLVDVLVGAAIALVTAYAVARFQPQTSAPQSL